MPKYSDRSKIKLETCDSKLQDLFNEVIKHFDCSILCGHRGEEEQNKVYHTGWSKLQFPRSKHNSSPSKAVDAAPYPIDWKDRERFYYFAGVVKGVALGMNISIRWGGDWDSDTQVKDQTFFDLPHFEVNE